MTREVFSEILKSVSKFKRQKYFQIVFRINVGIKLITKKKKCFLVSDVHCVTNCCLRRITVIVSRHFSQ